MHSLRLFAVIGVLAAAGNVGPADASVMVGGRTFNDNAFADSVTLPSVTYLLSTGAGTTK